MTDMTPLPPNLPLSRDQLAAFCEKWLIVEFSLFGSVLRQDFRADSDIDVLVTFAANAHWSMFDIIHMEAELAQLTGRKIDIAERPAVQHSRNQPRARHILSSARLIYGA